MYTDELEALQVSDQRLVRTVDSLSDAEWSTPSLLPGWSKAHVVAHLALNAEGFAGAIGGLQDGEPVPVYLSNEARDAAIEDLAGEEASEIRERLFAATTHLRHSFAALTAEQWSGTVNRLPEGPVWPVTQLLMARRQEVEVHHADLGCRYTPNDWPTDFTIATLERTVRNHAHSDATTPFAVTATDLGRTIEVGATAPIISGTAAMLTWWLLGRGDGEELVGQRPLPTVGPWQMPPPPGR